MGDDDPFPFGVGEDPEGADPEADAEGKARDIEGELLDRQASPADRIASKVDELEATDTPKEVAVPFWTAVIFADVGVLLVVLGPLVAYFRGQLVAGAVLTLAGVYALFRTYATYREFKRRSADDASDGSA